MSDHHTCPVEGKSCLSEREAGEIINACRHHRNMSKKIPRRSYRCKHCGTYHVTSIKAKYVSKDAYYKMDKR